MNWFVDFLSFLFFLFPVFVFLYLHELPPASTSGVHKTLCEQGRMPSIQACVLFLYHINQIYCVSVPLDWNNITMRSCGIRT